MSDLYTFGWIDQLLDINFPASGVFPPDTSQPWYYYLPLQTPTYFQYIGSQLGGRGWQCEEFLPVIRILPIDTQKMVPTTPLGFGSLEEVINRTNAGEKISQDAWGRINFKDPFFWKVLGLPSPPSWISFANGLPRNKPTAQGRPPADKYISDAIHDWNSTWNNEANNFNLLTQDVNGDGSYGQYGAGTFALPVPGYGASTINVGALKPGSYYFGPIPPFVTFERGQALIFKQSFAFQYRIGQLDPTVWNMNVFPPKVGDDSKAETRASSVSGLFNGYGSIDFPLNSPDIT